MGERIYNFSAGPAMMPEPVLTRAAAEMLDWNGSGMSVMEMSHRSKTYAAIFDDVERSLRALMGIPDTYRVLFLQGGATLQFSMIPINLLPRTGRADYAITGEFSKKAFKEGQKVGEVRAAADLSGENFSRIPAQSELALDAGAAYFHYCMNNTIFGTKWPYIPETGDVPLACDMSSCILSEPVDVSRFGLIYAGAQKNMGPAGLTVVILREDLAGAAPPSTPGLLDYAALVKSGSMLNTPPTYGIYLLGLVLDWVRDQGGLDAMRIHNLAKAAVLYDALDESRLFKPSADKASRSMMNVTFFTGDPALDDLFVKEAAAAGLVTLKGHRAVGGMRASIYNAMPMEGVVKLAAFMRAFEKQH
ncbi:MAG: 3-phosphoserine/phosphohydroxythreonine transaminase [Oscillospiraceae bacterium]|jgi:phosphoserine aminotransferase|nr:3-phosphoserine/phosphohydroxythreonine transaminase [Oscillospiraceae bacterium]